MIGQRAPELEVRPAIGPYGCYFMCLAWLAWRMDGATQTPERIIRAYDRLVADRAMSELCFVWKPAEVLRALGGSGRFLGKMGADWVPEGPTVELWVAPRAGGGTWRHFVGRAGPEVWDPWPGSVTRRDGWLDSYRAFAS